MYSEDWIRWSGPLEFDPFYDARSQCWYKSGDESGRRYSELYSHRGRVVPECNPVIECWHQALAVLDYSRNVTRKICGSSEDWEALRRHIYDSRKEEYSANDLDWAYSVPVSEPVRACWDQALSEGYSRNVTPRICGSSKEWEGFHLYMNRQSEATYQELHDMLPRLKCISASFKR